MGWSREGLRVMAELLAYKSSGGKIELKHFKDSDSTYKLGKRIIKKVSQDFGKVSREQFNNVTILSQGKVVPGFKWLRGLQNGSNIL